jgi:hypothetical protein
MLEGSSEGVGGNDVYSLMLGVGWEVESWQEDGLMHCIQEHTQLAA